MVTVAKAGKADAAALLKAKIDAFSWDVRTYGYGPPGYDSLECQMKAFDDAQAHCFKLLDGTELIGGACVFAPDPYRCHLDGLYIATAYQNRGIGTQAVGFLFQRFPDADCWTLETPYLSYRNHHFCEKLGFKKVGETQPQQDGFYLFQYEWNRSG